MKTEARICLVIAALILAIGTVYALSTNRPPGDFAANAPGITSKALESTTPQNSQRVAANPGTPPQSTVPQNNAAESKPVSLSPDLSHTDAYEFLDPVSVGKPAPNFSATTADGKPVRLADFKNKKNLVIVFYQGSFCSVCGAQLANLQTHLADFKKQDAEIIAVSADDKAHALQSVGEHGLTFPVIPDANKSIIKQFGIANISKKSIAWPSAFVVDKKGVVQLSFASQEGHRLHSNELLPVLSKLTGRPAPHLGYD